MAVRVEVGKGHFVSVDIQSQQSAENGTVACGDGPLSACTRTRDPQNVG